MKAATDTGEMDLLLPDPAPKRAARETVMSSLRAASAALESNDVAALTSEQLDVVIEKCQTVQVPLDGQPHRERLIARSIEWHHGIGPRTRVPPYERVHYFYSVEDEDEREIYVGITASPLRRWRAHKRSHFAAFAAKVFWCACLDLELAALIEKHVIRTARPIFNTHLADRKWNPERDGYLARQKPFAGEVEHLINAVWAEESPHVTWASKHWTGCGAEPDPEAPPL